MGDIAEAMLEGAMCPCGEFIDDGMDQPGFPRFCSPQCQRDYGGDTHQFEDLQISNQRHLQCDFFESTDQNLEWPEGTCGRLFKTQDAMDQHKRDRHGWEP